MAIAIDGTGNGTGSSSITATASLTTSSTNDYIIACARFQATALTSVSGSTLGTFTKIAENINSGNNVTIWAIFSSGTISSETITATQSQAFDMTLDVFGVSGTNQSSLVWDSGGPVVSNSSPQNFTNATADCLLVNIVNWFIANPNAGTGFTALSGSGPNGDLTQYKLLSSTGTTSIGTGNDGLVNSFAAVGIPLASGGGGGGGTTAIKPVKANFYSPFSAY